MENLKTIKINELTWKNLSLLKIRLNVKNYSEAIAYAIKWGNIAQDWEDEQHDTK